ncbi:MAG: non-heme iron oxygenase ferredoxin subunit [Microbacteriaceae bacterium]
MTRELICELDELAPGTARKVVIGDLPIAVVRQSDGSVHALGDRCSHGDISLSEGFVEDDTIECWAHGSKFDLCSGVPRNFPAFEPVPVYTVTIEGGKIFIDTENGK